MGDRLTVLERSEGLCKELSKYYKKALFIQGDYSNLETLNKAEIRTADILVAATDSDGQNMFITKLAKSQGVPKIIVLINNPKNRIEGFKAGANTIICPVDNALALFESAIRKVDAITLLLKEDEDFKLIEYNINSFSPLIGKKLKDFNLPKKSKISAVKRGEELFFPDENFVLMLHDKLFINGNISPVEKAVKLLRNHL